MSSPSIKNVVYATKSLLEYRPISSSTNVCNGTRLIINT